MTMREEFETWLMTRGEYGVDLAFAAWQASRTAALEEAAKECDLMMAAFERKAKNQAPHSIAGDYEWASADAAEQCAMGIRALKD